VLSVCFDYFFFSSRRRHTRWPRDWSSDVCSSDLEQVLHPVGGRTRQGELPAPAAALEVDPARLLELVRERDAPVRTARVREREERLVLGRDRPVCRRRTHGAAGYAAVAALPPMTPYEKAALVRSEEHTSELQSRGHLV